MQDYGILETLLKLGPLPLLGLMLNGLLWMLKRTKAIPDGERWMIPWLAILIGMLMMPLLLRSSDLPYEFPSPLTAKIAIGFGVGLASVGSNQWFIKTLQKLGFFRDES